MWKLAQYVHGNAGWPLVETYDTERRPVAQEIARQSLENSINVVRINSAAAAGTDSGLTAGEIVTESRRYGNHLGIELGAAYTSPAVAPDGTAPPSVDDSYSDYAPCATPGCRAPHVWLGPPGAARSTLDLIGAGFTLLAADGAGGWPAASAEAADELGVDIDCYVVGSPGLENRGQVGNAYGLDAGGAVLVRPDGHIAWRQARGPADGAALTEALRRILAT
jgi:putative polyketide hydroxylase